MIRITKNSLLFLLIFSSFIFYNSAAAYGTEAYTVISRRDAPQYEGKSTVYRHTSSGATVVYIETNDSEKAFTIGFPTPTHDDTGVNHILEHCLLGGSTHAESKPFTWLINHTGATFLNAMTFHDFTVYVLASRDESEYRGLITTYLDRIFYPSALSDEEIFKQEGWRLGDEGYNGTVYNEMKGVYSTDGAYLQKAVNCSLFPDSTYQYDSGGIPEIIPSLTFEQFKDVYNTNYRPENALIVLYGKQDIRGTLKLLDENYLSQKQGLSTLGHVKNPSAYTVSTKPVSTHAKKPVSTHAKQPASTHAKKPASIYATYPAEDGLSSMALSYAVCDRSDSLLAARLELLASLLDDGNASVFNDIIRQGYASQVNIEYNSMMEQCVLSIVLKGIDPLKQKEIKALTDNCLKHAVKNEFNEKRIDFILHRYLYNLADAKNTPHRGIDAGIEEMSAFVYGHAIDEAVYRNAIKTFDKKFIKQAINEYLLNNPHSSVVILTPEQKHTVTDGTVQEQQLDKASCNSAASFVDCTLPRFTLPSSEMGHNLYGVKPPVFKGGQIQKSGGSAPDYNIESKDNNVKLIHTNIDTHGISSIHLFWDASSLPQPLIGYAQILAHTFADTSALPSDASIGEIYGYLSADKTMGGSDFTPRLHLIMRGLNSDIPSMTKTGALLLDPNTLPDKRIVRNYLIRAKMAMDDGFENQMPLSGCLARLSNAGLYDYEINGLTYYQFISGLLSDFEHVWPTISENLINVKKILLNSSGTIFSFTGSDTAYKSFRKQAGALISLFPKAINAKQCPASPPAAYSVPEPVISVFPAPLSQTYAVVQGGSLKKADSSYSGSFLVSASMLNYDYLWPLVRDSGGAYGVNVSITHDGLVLLRSYRDPNKEKTLEAYSGIPAFLRQPADDNDFAGVRAHVLSEWDEQFQPYKLWDYGAKVELGVINPEIINRTRLEIVYSQPGDLKYDADIWEGILKQGVTAVGGKPEKF